MAKQTFTSGQILTAAQVNALQSNDYNWTVTPKTSSYILTATDAGTRVTMSNASATTITINTATMTAGDVVYLLNIGAGVCTVTAGAGVTIASPGNLALIQNAGGYLFAQSSTSFYFLADGIAQTRLLASQVLTVAASTFDTNTILGGNISQAYNQLRLVMQLRGDTAANTVALNVRFNNDSTASYDNQAVWGAAATAAAQESLGATQGIYWIGTPAGTATASRFGQYELDVANYTGTTAFKSATGRFNSSALTTSGNTYAGATSMVWRNTGAITRVAVFPSAGNWAAGSSFYLYGIL